MKRNNKKPLASSAEVIDNHLILSLTNAIDPIVWRMDLDKIGTASFEIKEIKTSAKHKLVLKPKKGTAETIATFEEKEDAMTALIQASDAMQKPADSVTTNEDKTGIIKETTAPKTKSSKKWLWLLLGFFTLIILYSYLLSLTPNRINNIGTAKSTGSTSSQESQSGVPMSADDFLNSM